MKLIPLDEAAEMLGISPEKLLDMRSRNDIFGYRDGSTWKFKQAELDRVASTLGVAMTEASPDGDSGVDLDLASETGDANILVDVDGDLDEMISVEDSGLLEVEEIKADTNDEVLELGAADDAELVLEDSDIELELDDKDLAIDEGSGLDLEMEDSGVKIAATEESDIELSMEDSDVSLAATDSDPELILDGGSDLQLDMGSDLEIEDAADQNAATIVGGESVDVTDEVPAVADGSGFEFDLSDVDLSDGSDAGKGVAAAGAAGLAAAGAAAAAAVGAAKDKAEDILDLDDGSDISLGEASDLELSMDDSSIELDLDGDASSSSIKLDESGINLTSPSDSGLSLEGTPELGAGSDVDALELGEAADDADIIDIGDEAVDLEEATVMAVDNDFLLEPVEGDMEDIDSGSQIIALDTEEIDPGSDSVLDEGAFVEATDELDPGLASLPDDGVAEVAPLGAAAASGAAVAPEIPYSVWNIVGLSLCTLLMAIGGLMMSDLVMNMWSWDGPYELNSQLMDSVLGIFGM